MTKSIKLIKGVQNLLGINTHKFKRKPFWLGLKILAQIDLSSSKETEIGHRELGSDHLNAERPYFQTQSNVVGYFLCPWTILRYVMSNRDTAMGVRRKHNTGRTTFSINCNKNEWTSYVYDSIMYII